MPWWKRNASRSGGPATHTSSDRPSGVGRVSVGATVAMMRDRRRRLREICAKSAAPIAAEAVLDARGSLEILLDYPDFCAPGDRPWASAAITKDRKSGVEGTTVGSAV